MISLSLNSRLSKMIFLERNDRDSLPYMAQDASSLFGPGSALGRMAYVSFTEQVKQVRLA